MKKGLGLGLKITGGIILFVLFIKVSIDMMPKDIDINDQITAEEIEKHLPDSFIIKFTFNRKLIVNDSMFVDEFWSKNDHNGYQYKKIIQIVTIGKHQYIQGANDSAVTHSESCKDKH